MGLKQSLLLILIGLAPLGCTNAKLEGRKELSAATPRWYKGNLHTHSLWSDGDDFPERIATWYRDHNYQFLAISDHNTLQSGDKWVRAADLKKKGALPAAEAYVRDFPTLAKTRGDVASGSYEVRLTPFEEYRPKLDTPGEFLLIPSEEITDKFGQKPIHMNATNLAGEPIKPQGGMSVVEVIRNNLRAVQARSKELNRPVMAHLNHPNFRWGVTAEDVAEVVEERFFEVFNGHPQVNQEGDETHPGIDRLWDIANTLRLTTFKAAPLMGLGTDDSHNYHVKGMNRSTSGRGWVCVRANELSAEALIAAMEAGDFYASSGVELKDVRYDAKSRTLRVDIASDGDAKFTTQFIGSRPPRQADQPVPPQDVGVVFATVEGTTATYRLTGEELYVRAVVTSDKAPVNPSWAKQKQQAWTQPIGWESRLPK